MGNIGPTEIMVLLLLLAAVVAGAFFVLRMLKSSSKTVDLVECRTCRKRISPRAETCPSCGEPRQVLRG
jgi:hypothetical protein